MGDNDPKWRPAVTQVCKGAKKTSDGMAAVLFTRPMKMEQSALKRQHMCVLLFLL